MRVVFLGTGEIGVPSLKALTTSGRHEVKAVFTQPDRPAGRDLKLRPPPVKAAAQELGLPVFQPEKIRSAVVLSELARLEPDVIVVAAYGQILPKAILSLPRSGVPQYSCLAAAAAPRRFACAGLNTGRRQRNRNHDHANG